MKKLLVLMAAVSAMSISAFAGSISYMNTTPTQTTPFSSAFTLPGYTGAAGTLLSVEIDFSATTSANLSVFNTTGSAGTFTNGFASVPLTVTSPTGVSNSVTATSNFASGSFGAGQGPYTFSGSPVTASATPYFAPNVTPYYSSVPLSFTVSGNSGSYGGTATPGVFFSGNATAGGTTTIIYTYSNPTGTPEPATMGLLGSALVGLGFLKFRSKKA